MPLGAHLPTSKGLQAVVEHALRLDCQCAQIFSKSPRQWLATPLDPAKTAAFRNAWSGAGLSPLVVHNSYLINLAAPDETVRAKSIEAMIDEVERAEMLGADYLVTHCGAHLAKGDPDGEMRGLDRLAESVKEIISRTPEAKVRIALENTAAAGTCLGGPFEHLAHALNIIDDDRVRVCFDTCHALAAGHRFTTAAEVKRTIANFEIIVGLKHLGVIHLNDSKGAFASKLDRHEHIGQGKIGEQAMRAFLRHAQLQHLPVVLETPETDTMLETNLNTVRQMRLTAGLKRGSEPVQI